jgi:hypothetical protein
MKAGKKEKKKERTKVLFFRKEPPVEQLDR